MRRLLFLLPILAWAQSPTGSVRAIILDPAHQVIPYAPVRLLSIEPVEAVATAQSGLNGVVRYTDVPLGRYLIAIDVPGFRETWGAVTVEASKEANAGSMELPLDGCNALRRTSCPTYVYWGDTIASLKPEPPPLEPDPIPILSVCEALETRAAHDMEVVVIVGIFKSGLDETLRQDCPNQLVTGDIGWMSAIALTRPTDPPESLRAEIEKKRAVILKSGPPGTQPRPERVVALYGRLVSPSGLTSIPCCTAPVEIKAAPARLVGLSETDFRVLR